MSHLPQASERSTRALKRLVSVDTIASIAWRPVCGGGERSYCGTCSRADPAFRSGRRRGRRPGRSSRGTLTNESGATLNNGTYFDDNESTFGNAGTLIDTPGGFFLNQFGSSTNNPAHFTNDGTITVQGGAQLDGSGGNVINNEAGATITVDSGGVFGGTPNLFNSGTIDNNGGQLDLSAAGDLFNQSGGTITSSGSFEIDGTLNNSSTVTIQTGGTVAITMISSTIHGTIINASGANIDNFGSVDNSGDVENLGTITDECGSSFTNGGTYTGNAVVLACT